MAATPATSGRVFSEITSSQAPCSARNCTQSTMRYPETSMAATPATTEPPKAAGASMGCGRITVVGELL